MADKVARFVVHGGASRVLISQYPERYVNVTNDKTTGERVILLTDPSTAEAFRESIANRGGNNRIEDTGDVAPPKPADAAPAQARNNA